MIKSKRYLKNPFKGRKKLLFVPALILIILGYSFWIVSENSDSAFFHFSTLSTQAGVILIMIEGYLFRQISRGLLTLVLFIVFLTFVLVLDSWFSIINI